MSVINLNIPLSNKKSNNFVLYPHREYQRLYGWKKQHDADKLFAGQRTHKQQTRSVSFLERFVAKLTNGEKLVLKYLLSMMLTAKKNKKPLQAKNQIIANEIGCSVWLVKQATKKFATAKIFAKEQSNKYSVNVYTCLVDEKSRGILYNLCHDTTPHILKIKEPKKALKKTSFQLYREAVQAAFLGYPHIHNLPTTDIIGDLFINQVYKVGDNKKGILEDNLNNNLISKGDYSAPETLKSQTLSHHPPIIADKMDGTPTKWYNKNSYKAPATSQIDTDTYHQEINRRLNPAYVELLKEQFKLEKKNEQESTQVNDIDLRLKLIDQAKKMYPDVSLSDCGDNLEVYRNKIDERTNLIRLKINELYKQHDIPRT